MILAFLLGVPFAWWMAVLAILFIADIVCFSFEAYGWSIFIMTASIAGAVWLDHNTTNIVAQHAHQLLYYIPGYLVLGLGTALVKWILYAAKRVSWISEAKSQFDAKPAVTETVPDFKSLAKEKASEEYNYGSRNRRTAFDMSEEQLKTFNERVEFLAKQFEEEWTTGGPARKRKAFVDFYQEGISNGVFGARSSHKIYPVDHKKETSVVDALSPRAKDNIGKLSIWVYQWPIVIISSLIEDFIIKLVKHFATALDAMFSKVVRGMVAKATKGL